MNKSLSILGGALLVVGVLWSLQGVGLVGGSFMTGQRHWLVIGIITAVAGVLLLTWSNLRGRL